MRTQIPATVSPVSPTATPTREPTSIAELWRSTVTAVNRARDLTLPESLGREMQSTIKGLLPDKQFSIKPNLFDEAISIKSRVSGGEKGAELWAEALHSFRTGSGHNELTYEVTRISFTYSNLILAAEHIIHSEIPQAERAQISAILRSAAGALRRSVDETCHALMEQGHTDIATACVGILNSYKIKARPREVSDRAIAMGIDPSGTGATLSLPQSGALFASVLSPHIQKTVEEKSPLPQGQGDLERTLWTPVGLALQQLKEVTSAVNSSRYCEASRPVDVTGSAALDLKAFDTVLSKYDGHTGPWREAELRDVTSLISPTAPNIHYIRKQLLSARTALQDSGNEISQGILLPDLNAALYQINTAIQGTLKKFEACPGFEEATQIIRRALLEGTRERMV